MNGKLSKHMIAVLRLARLVHNENFRRSNLGINPFTSISRKAIQNDPVLAKLAKQFGVNLPNVDRTVAALWERGLMHSNLIGRASHCTINQHGIDTLTATMEKRANRDFAKNFGAGALAFVHSEGTSPLPYDAIEYNPVYPDVTLVMDASGSIHAFNGDHAKIGKLYQDKYIVKLYPYDAPDTPRESDVLFSHDTDQWLILAGLPADQRDDLNRGYTVVTRFVCDEYFG